jgi:phage shock protein E
MGAVDSPGGEDRFADLSPAAALAYLRANAAAPDFSLLDTRTPEEFEASHFEGAQILDVYDPGFQERLQGLDRSRRYFVYCRTGNRSGFTVSLMQRLGFAEAHNLLGGIKLWLEKGLPLAVPPD